MLLRLVPSTLETLQNLVSLQPVITPMTGLVLSLTVTLLPVRCDVLLDTTRLGDCAARGPHIPAPWSRHEIQLIGSSSGTRSTLSPHMQHYTRIQMSSKLDNQKPLSGRHSDRFRDF